MSFRLKESVGVCAIALLNGYFVYPRVKQIYRSHYSLRLPQGDPSHFVSLVYFCQLGNLDFYGLRSWRQGHWATRLWVVRKLSTKNSKQLPRFRDGRLLALHAIQWLLFVKHSGAAICHWWRLCQLGWSRKRNRVRRRKNYARRGKLVEVFRSLSPGDVGRQRWKHRLSVLYNAARGSLSQRVQTHNNRKID